MQRLKCSVAEVQTWHPLQSRAAQLDSHNCPNCELLTSSRCQRNVNPYRSLSLLCKQTCKWEPFFSLQRQDDNFLACSNNTCELATTLNMQHSEERWSPSEIKPVTSRQSVYIAGLGYDISMAMLCKAIHIKLVLCCSRSAVKDHWHH